MSEYNNKGSRRLGRLRKLAAISISILLCLGLAEVAARAFWKFQYGVPFLDPSRILYAYYPELKIVDKVKPRHGSKTFDILLLGGSVLHRVWGTVERELREQLAYAGHRRVRIFNLATEAQTSRDSRLKYAALGDARFDLVIFYHAINETRANNVPPELFRRDYGHYSWYEVVNELARHHGSASFALPYTAKFLTIRVNQRLNKDNYVPAHHPRSEWMRYGANPLSTKSYEENVQAILDSTAQRGDRTMLMTFAVHLPPDYTYQAYQEKRLDYVLHNRRTPIEIWGEPDNVTSAVATHNEVIKRLAGEHSEVLLVDQAGLMNGTARYFNDPCHFTTTGSAQFVANLLPALLPAL